MINNRLAQVLIPPNTSIHKVLEVIDRNGLRGVIVSDEEQELLLIEQTVWPPDLSSEDRKHFTAHHQAAVLCSAAQK